MLGFRGRFKTRFLWVFLTAFAAFVAAGCAGGDQGGSEAAADLTEEQRQKMERLGLDTDQPYAGTELNFLICCHTAPQFASLTDLTNSEFTKLTGIEVNWGEVPFSAFQDKVVTEATTGGTYDMVGMVDAWGPSITSSLVPLDDKLQSAGRDMSDYPPAFQQAATTGSDDGTIYGMPLRGHPLMYFYRKDIYDQMGMQPPETWNEFVDQGQQIKQNQDISPTAMYYSRSGGQNMWLWLAHLYGNDGGIFDENYRPVFNNAEGVEATERYVNYLKEYEITPPPSVNWNEQEANQEFNKGRAATFMGWWWMYSLMTGEDATEQVRNNVEYAPMPGWEGEEAQTYAQVWLTGILKSSQNQDAAWEYLKWMTHKDTEKRVVMREEPDFNTNVAVHMSNLRDQEVNEQSDDLHQTAARVLQNSRTLPLLPEWPEVESVLNTAINDIAGGADAEARLDQAATEVEGIMEREGYYE